MSENRKRNQTLTIRVTAGEKGAITQKAAKARIKAYWNVAGSPVLTRSITNERLAQAGYYSILARYESLHLCD